MILKILLVIFIPLFAFLLVLADQNFIRNKPLETVSKNISFENVQKKAFSPNYPSIEKIFAKDHSWIATLSAQRKRVLLATGDVIAARSVNFKTVSLKNFKWPYERIADVLKDADITFINLETPLIKNCPLTQEGMIFCGDGGNVEGLVYSGVDMVSLANNHAANYGENGVLETVELLEKNGILVTGINGPKVLDIRGVKFAFLGYNDISKNQRRH